MVTQRHKLSWLIDLQLCILVSALNDVATRTVPAVLTTPNPSDCQAGWNFGTAAQIWVRVSVADLPLTKGLSSNPRDETQP